MALVFALGSNGSGQLGIGHIEDVSVPKPVLWADDAPKSILSLAAGGNHTLLLDEDGSLYWSGDSSTGACGIASPRDRVPQPCFTRMEVGRVEGPAGSRRRVSMVAATWEASILVVLDDEGKNTKVYSCGLGPKGELGQGPLIIRDPHATQLANFPPAGTTVVDIAACMSHVVTVLSNGDVYGWGNGRKGQLGSPTTSISKPQKIEGIDFLVERAVCGKEFTCLLGDNKTGRLLVLGSDKWGIKSNAPSAVPGWKDIGAGWSNVFILKDDGDMQIWGRNGYAQSVSPAPQKTVKMAIGSEHALALLESGNVLAWGWGEHGNCGPPTKGEDDGNKRRKIIVSSKYLPPGNCISMVGAGCATSWVVINTSQDGP